MEMLHEYYVYTRYTASCIDLLLLRVRARRNLLVLTSRIENCSIVLLIDKKIENKKLET